MNPEVAFWILSAAAVLGALGAVSQRNLVHGVYALMLFFGSLAGMFLLLMAEFIAAVQILVYIGAVGILLLFAIMLTERVTGNDARRVFARGWFWGLVVAAAVFWLIIWPAISNLAPELAKPVSPSVKQMGQQLMDPYVVSLEIIALLLTAALIGAVAAAQGARTGDEEEETE